MILNLSLIADLQILQKRRQQLIDECLICANRSCFSHDYPHEGEKVLKLIYKPDKLQPKAEGPYCVHQVHMNGSTVTIQKNTHTIERFDASNHIINNKEV
jgi:aspartate carbamoyltransferase regulatory subunit